LPDFLVLNGPNYWEEVKYYQRGIGCAEWVQQKIAFARSAEYRDQEILAQLRYIRRKFKYAEDKYPGLEELDEMIHYLL